MSTPTDWRTLVLEAIGRVIAFWGFKRNHGRLWALLYLAGEPLSAPEIGRRLGLSKGAVSMVVRELESWAVIRQVPGLNRAGVAYAAERDIWLMVRSVLERRELRLVTQVRDDLESALALVAEDGRLSPAEREAVTKRIRLLRRFADAGRVAVEAFLRSRRLELRWSSRATISLPVPVSPVTSTETSWLPACSTSRWSSRPSGPGPSTMGDSSRARRFRAAMRPRASRSTWRVFCAARSSEATPVRSSNASSSGRAKPAPTLGMST